MAFRGPMPPFAYGRSFTTTMPMDQKDEQKVTGSLFDGSVFADNMLKKLQTTNANMILSPYSLLCALTICMNGATSNTLEQFNKVLYSSQLQATPENAAKYHENLCKLNDIYKKNQHDNIMIANCVWINDKWKLLNAYKKLIGGQLAVTINFVNVSYVVDTINNWVSMNTMRRITEIIREEHLNARTTPLVITNAMYFKAQFQIPFDIQSTEQNQPFYASSWRWSKISNHCTMMNGAEPYWYEYCKFENSFNCIKLRYRSNFISLILVQAIGYNAHRYFKCAKLKEMNKLLSRTIVDLYVPKFKDEFEFDANDVLKDMGLTDAFSSTKANFSGMVEDAKKDQVYIAHVLHKAVIEVDEKGTIAAAATAVVMDAECGGCDSSSIITPHITIRYDYPFQYFIYDELNCNLLFAGKINKL